MMSQQYMFFSLEKYQYFMSFSLSILNKYYDASLAVMFTMVKVSFGAKEGLDPYIIGDSLDTILGVPLANWVFVTLIM